MNLPDPEHAVSRPEQSKQASNLWAAFWRLVFGVNRGFAQLMRHPVLTAIASLVIFLVALRVINSELSQYTLQDLQKSIDDIGFLTIFASLVAATLCYGALAFNDRFALSMLGKRLPHARTARASLAAYALANTLGYSWATAATARQRLYRKWGLLPAEIGTLSFLTGTAVQVGGLAAAGLGLLLAAREVALHGPLNQAFWFFVGLLILVPAVFWMLYAEHGPMKSNALGAPISRPKPEIAVAHLSAIIIDWMGAAAILYFLLPNHGGWSFPAFLAVYVLAGMLGAVSGAPGGLGVFEAAILTLAPVSQDTPGAAVALVLYRLIYNIIPLALATIILGLDQAAPAARPAARVAVRVGSKVGEQLSEAAEEFGPRVNSILVFAAGFGMLGAVATPPITARLVQLANMNLTHFSEAAFVASGIIGLLLLFVAAALWQRMRGAWAMALILLTIGALVALLKGLSYEEAIVITVVFATVLVLRSEQTSDVTFRWTQLSPRWLALIFGSLATIIWIANFAYPNWQENPKAWLDFAIENDVGRTLRALGGMIVMAIVILAVQLFLPKWAKVIEGENDD